MNRMYRLITDGVLLILLFGLLVLPLSTIGLLQVKTQTAPTAEGSVLSESTEATSSVLGEPVDYQHNRYNPQ